MICHDSSARTNFARSNSDRVCADGDMEEEREDDNLRFDEADSDDDGATRSASGAPRRARSGPSASGPSASGGAAPSTASGPPQRSARSGGDGATAASRGVTSSGAGPVAADGLKRPASGSAVEAGSPPKRARVEGDA